jgi:hypothetical protein
MVTRERTTTTYLPYEIRYPEFSGDQREALRLIQYYYLDVDVLKRPAIIFPTVESNVGYGFMERKDHYSKYSTSPAFFTIDSRRFWWPKSPGNNWDIGIYLKFSSYGSHTTTSGYGAFPTVAELSSIQKSNGLENPARKGKRPGILDWDDVLVKEDDNRDDFIYLLRGI